MCYIFYLKLFSSLVAYYQLTRLFQGSKLVSTGSSSSENKNKHKQAPLAAANDENILKCSIKAWVMLPCWDTVNFPGYDFKLMSSLKSCLVRSLLSASKYFLLFLLNGHVLNVLNPFSQLSLSCHPLQTGLYYSTL